MTTHRVINVTRRTRLQAVEETFGIAMMVFGWLLLAGAILQAVGIVLTVLLGFSFIVFGRRLVKR